MSPHGCSGRTTRRKDFRRSRSSRSPTRATSPNPFDIPTAVTQIQEGARASLEVADTLVVLGGDDVLLAPSMPVPAFGVELASPASIDGRPVDQLFDDWCVLALPANLTGQPACAVPTGFDEDGLPVGLQVMGPRVRPDGAGRRCRVRTPRPLAAVVAAGGGLTVRRCCRANRRLRLRVGRWRTTSATK